MATKKRKKRSTGKKSTGKRRGREKGYKHSAATKRKIAAAARARYKSGKSALARVNAGKRHHKPKAKHPRAREYVSLEERARAKHARRHGIKYKAHFVARPKAAHAGLARTHRGTVVTPYMQLMRKRLAERRANAPAHSATEQAYYGFAL